MTLLCYLFLAIIFILAWGAESSPAPKSGNGEFFSATRAVGDLEYLLREQVAHPTGSAANVIVKDRIEAKLKELGYTPEEQAAFVCSYVGVCAQVHNLLVRIPGGVAGRAVMLVAHYDSVAAGPGAADDGSGVVILLEVARLLKSEPVLPSPLILLFDDGEEQSLLGALAFVEKSPDARNVQWVVNLDARGVSGPSFMYETSSDNADLIKLYAGVVSRPVTNSLMYSLYKLLPSTTDFSVFRQHGIEGFNLAFVGGTPLYHRTGDIPSNTSSQSVQHQGETAWDLVRALATHPPRVQVRGDAVFFDVFRQVIWWPQGWTPYLAFSALVLVLGATVRIGRPQVSPASMLWGVLALILAIAVPGLAGFLLLKVLIPGDLLPPDFPAYPFHFALAFCALAVAISAIVFAWISRRTTLWAFMLGNYGAWTALSFLVHVSLAGASYLFLAPAIAASLCLALVAYRGVDKPLAAEAAILAPAAVAVALWLPLTRLLYEALGKVSLPIISFAVATILMVTFPLLWGRVKLLYRLAAIAVAVTSISSATSLLVPRYTHLSPFPLNIQYAQQGESGEPHWLLGLRQRNRSRVGPLLKAASFAAETNPSHLLPWLPSGYPLYSAPAPDLALPMPQMDVLEHSSDQGRLSIHARLQSPRGAERITMYFPPAARIVSMQIGGQAIPPLPQDYLQSSNGWQCYTSTFVQGGIDVQFAIDVRGSSDMYVLDETYGLPTQGDPLLRARPPDASASQDGNSTVLFRHVLLSGLN